MAGGRGLGAAAASGSYDGKNTLAAYIASVSDTDDIVPTLVALQIEWNKFHWLLNADPTTMQLLESRVDRSSPVYAEITKVVRERLRVSLEDWRRLEVIWGDNVWTNLLAIGRERKNFTLRMLGGSHVGFVRVHAQLVGASHQAARRRCGWAGARSTSSPAIRIASPTCFSGSGAPPRG